VNKRTVTVDSVDKTSFTQLIHVRGATSLTLTFTDTNLEATDMVIITAGDTSNNPHQSGGHSEMGGHAQALALPGWQLGDYLEYDAEYATTAAAASETAPPRAKGPAELKRADSTTSLGGGGSGGMLCGAMDDFEQPTR
jgi:fructose-specific component phosphotransferase system IIB-like protein